MTTHTKKDLPIKKANRRQRVIKGTIIGLTLLLFLWIGSIGSLAMRLLDRAGRLQRMAANPASMNLANLADEVHSARQEFSILHAEIAPMLWISSLFNGDAGVVKPLADAGGEMLKAGDEVLGALSPALTDVKMATLSKQDLPRILDALAGAQPELISAQNHIDSAAEAIAHIQGPLSPRIEYWVSRAGKLMRVAQAGIRGVQILPELIAYDGKRTYLVLLQNSYELRPTGGFISAVIKVELDHGQLGPIAVEDSYVVDDFTNNYPDPPSPLLDYMGSEQWVFRDANWSPDFPTSALEAIHLYQISRPGELDGVIGITTEGVGALIASVGTLEVEGLPEPVTAANFNRIIQEMWNPGTDSRDWFNNRKKSLNLIMQTAMEKFFAGKVDWSLLGRGLMDALDQRQLMIYSVPEASELKQLLWDGSLRSNPGDYLMVVDANLGFNKVNPLISEDMNYRVELWADGTGQADLNLNYAHQGKKANVLCTQLLFTKAVTYEDLVNTCYYDYLRLVVPEGSHLISATAHPIPGQYLISGVDQDGEVRALPNDLKGRMVFSQFFVVEYGKKLSTYFQYDLPKVVKDIDGRKQYVLLLQKQAGTNNMPVKVELALPARAQLISSKPVPSSISDGTLFYDLHEDVDQQIEITYTIK
jgi:hypothetical protein